MENRGVEELVVHLDQALDLTSMEQGVKLIGKVLTSKLVNKWGVRNILRSTWKDWGEVDIKWVRDNTFLILVQDESMASKILEQVPWAVMKKVFSVKKWPPELALEEVEMETVPFWVQIRGVPLGLTSATNIQRLTQAAGQFIALEDPGKARGFLRVRILIDTGEGAAAYGEWTKAPPVRDVLEPLRTIIVGRGERRQADEVRGSGLPLPQNQREGRVLPSARGDVTWASAVGESSVHQGSSQKKWRRKQRPLVLTGQVSQTVGDEDRPSLPQVEIGGSSPNKSGSQQEGPANTEDVFIVNGAAEWGLKRGMVSKGLELSSSPLKKFRGPGLEVNYPGRGADLWRRMSVQETCLVVERAFLTEDERRVGHSEARDQKEFLEEGPVTDQELNLVHQAGKIARGGGG
ncbi:hypothetical protein ACFX15_008282 [Malus domestica]